MTILNKQTLMVGAAIAIGVPTSASAQAQACSSPYYVEQAFPTTGAEQTRWRLCWQSIDGNNLVITGAWFRTAPSAPWTKLIYDARVAELFVPYHPGGPRFYNVGYNFPPYPLTATDCPGPSGVVLGTNRETCKEVRDRGLAWKHDSQQRRGQELVLWSVMAAANYNYIVEWTFRDDGVVLGRVGGTGEIAGPNTHVHGPVWRLDIDLKGACCDVVSTFKHTESGATGVDTHSDIKTEGGRKWDPTSFTMFGIRDQTLANANGKSSSWHLMPIVMGTPLHQEPFTKNTAWVTRYRWSEKSGGLVDTYANGESVLNQDVVLWYYGGLHHAVRDEDTEMTHLMWVGFMLMPFNVFSTTPFFP